MKNEISTNHLRAISAAVLLVLALTSIFKQQSNSTLDIILITLASFLVGGALLTKDILNKK